MFSDSPPPAVDVVVVEAAAVRDAVTPEKKTNEQKKEEEKQANVGCDPIHHLNSQFSFAYIFCFCVISIWTRLYILLPGLIVCLCRLVVYNSFIFVVAP